MFIGNCFLRKIVGFFLVLLGVVLLICFMPFWMWLALIGIGMLVAGVIILLRGL